MENEATVQPLDALMTQLGLSNADLVKASTEQLTFKMVHKGRTGHRLSSNVQEKIHNALLAAKPGLKIRRRDLFRYEPGESFIEGINRARVRVASGELKYPEYVELLAQAGVVGYTAEVASHRITYFGTGGEAHEEKGPETRSAGLGAFNEAAVRAAIADAQKAAIDFPEFLRRIHEAGIVRYEVNLRSRRIVYLGEEQSYREKIGAPGPDLSADEPQPQKAGAAISPSKKKKLKRKTRSLTRKARMTSNKRWRQKQKEKRRR